MRNPKIFVLTVFAFCSLNVFAQVDSIAPLSFRVGVGIFSMPGFYAETGITKEISVEAGILTFLILSEASVGLKYHILGENNFKMKVGIGCGMTTYFWYAKTDPPKSGKDIYILPLIPIEFIYKRFSLELQPGYPIKIAGDDEGKIPLIAFLSYIIPL